MTWQRSGVAVALAMGCAEVDAAPPATRLMSTVILPVARDLPREVDILFGIDDSGSMLNNQANLARSIGALFSELVTPRPERPNTRPIESLHVGVITADLGTPGSRVPACANSDVGDDGLLNPIRHGLAMRAHQPWSSAGRRFRPTRCENRPDQYPSFLTFTATSDLTDFAEDFACNAILSGGASCGLEQQLEAAYRALVIHPALEGVAGNSHPNAGFVRDDAMLAIVLVTDEEDGSTRDCRYREPGDPDGTCPMDGSGSRLGVFDSTDPSWSSADLNLRFYMYPPGGAQDPTWPLNRYIDPRRPDRGFTSLKPGRPDLVLFAAIAGVPIHLPQVAGTSDPNDPANLDWTALLGNNSDGSEGLVTMSPEGPISMRQRNADPNCSTRVVPACRREGSAYDPMACDTTRQYFAWPARRIAEVARRFAVTYQGNGMIRSICQNDYSDALRTLGRRITLRYERFPECLPRILETTPRICCDAVGQPFGCVPSGDASREACTPASTRTAVLVNCVVRESLPSSVSAAEWCVPARGRRPGGRDANLRETCLVDQLPVVLGERPTQGEGFFYDTTPGECPQRITFTPDAALARGSSAILECIQSQN
ncbi:MAG: hypothetical protein R3A48_27520 [Polyangiales bacterium]